MANDLSEITPQLLAQGLMTLREVAVMPQLVNRRYEALAGEKGSTIDVPIPSAIVSNDVAPLNTPPAMVPIAPTTVPIPLNYWREASFTLTDQDILQAMTGVIPMQAAEAVKSLANFINTTILALYKKFYGWAGVAGTTPFTTTRDATSVRKILNKQLAPIDDRHMVIDPEAEESALNLRAFQDMSWANSPSVITDGTINRKFGFDWWSHQLIPNHVKGTATSITTAVLTALGETVVTLKVASGTGTLVAGDIITFAGQTQTYVVVTGVTLTTGGVATTISPPLQAAVDGSGTPVAVTLKGSHTANLGFHRDAIAFATRPLQNVAPGLGSITDTLADPDSGLTLRLEVTREHRQTKWAYDILFGTSVVRPELGCRLAG